jgi:hypothetical protein
MLEISETWLQNYVNEVNEVYESQRLEPPMVKKKEVDDRM